MTQIVSPLSPRFGKEISSIFCCVARTREKKSLAQLSLTSFGNYKGSDGAGPPMKIFFKFFGLAATRSSEMI
jgi:hypothetical protein